MKDPTQVINYYEIYLYVCLKKKDHFVSYPLTSRNEIEPIKIRTVDGLKKNRNNKEISSHTIKVQSSSNWMPYN